MIRRSSVTVFLALLLPTLLAACVSSNSPPPSPTPADLSAMSVSVIEAALPSEDSNLRWQQVSATGSGVLAVRSDGSLWGWGAMVSSEDPREALVPTRVGGDSDWRKVSAGPPDAYARAAIKTDGSLWVWGENFWDILATSGKYVGTWGPVGGESSERWDDWFPMMQVGGNEWQDVAVGGAHMLAIKTDGTLWAWGARFSAALGDGELVSMADRDNPLFTQVTPVRIGTGDTWRRVSAGYYFSLGLKADGSLWQWGSDFTGGSTYYLPPQNDPADFLPTPTRVGGEDDRFTDLAAGTDHALAVHEDGSLWAWGCDAAVPAVVDPGPWKTVAGGDSHSLGVKTDGTLWAWGDNHNGKLGNGSLEPSTYPVQVGTASDWEAVACGKEFSAALKAKSPDGKLWLWGMNDSGQLGNGLSARANLPTQVGRERGWRGAAASWGGTFALRPDGTLWGWGVNWGGCLGNDTLQDSQIPMQAGSGDGWAAVAPGMGFTLALQQDGSLWSWGSDDQGCLGDGLDMGYQRASPERIGSEQWKAAFAGAHCAFAIREDGTLWSWGYDVYNQLGLGNDHLFVGTQHVEWMVPTPAQVGTAANWRQLASSSEQTLAVRDDGSLWAWGSDVFSPLGNGLVSTGSPARMGTASDWRFVAASGSHSAALKEDGSLWTWGWNISGELGDGTFTDRESAVRVGGETWKSVALIRSETVAVRSDGTLWHWGGVTPRWPEDMPMGSNAPVQVGNAGDWSTVSAAEYGNHWVALKEDGTLWTWGENWHGQLGNLAAWTPYPVWIP